MLLKKKFKNNNLVIINFWNYYGIMIQKNNIQKN